eukprot:11358087-Ditylum_brightwellii.AAC.1
MKKQDAPLQGDIDRSNPLGKRKTEVGSTAAINLANILTEEPTILQFEGSILEQEFQHVPMVYHTK